MDKEYIILLKDFKFGRCGLVNQFLIDNELQDDLRVVLAEYERTPEIYSQGGVSVYADPNSGQRLVKERCIGLEVIDEKRAFYYQLRGHKVLEQKIKDYDKLHG